MWHCIVNIINSYNLANNSKINKMVIIIQKYNDISNY